VLLPLLRCGALLAFITASAAVLGAAGHVSNAKRICTRCMSTMCDGALSCAGYTRGAAIQLGMPIRVHKPDDDPALGLARQWQLNWIQHAHLAEPHYVALLGHGPVSCCAPAAIANRSTSAVDWNTQAHSAMHAGVRLLGGSQLMACMPSLVCATQASGTAGQA
jgi:hypothetical protein